MTKKDKIFINIYKILLSVSIAVAGMCLIAGCLYIYYSGGGYSRQIVIDTFSKICIPVYICLGLVIVSFVVNAIIPYKQKEKTIKHYNQMYLNLLKHRDTSGCSDGINKIKNNKKTLNIINIAIIIVCSIVFLLYALNGNNFHTSQINSSMIKAMWVLLPCIAVSFAFSVITYYQNIKYTKKQIDILKAMPFKNEQNAIDTTVNNTKQKKILIIKIAILIIGVAVLIFGAVTGGFADVLTKAVNICTECIGLG